MLARDPHLSRVRNKPSFLVRYSFITRSINLLQEILITLHIITYKQKKNKKKTSSTIPLYSCLSPSTPSGISCRRRVLIAKTWTLTEFKTCFAHAPRHILGFSKKGLELGSMILVVPSNSAYSVIKFYDSMLIFLEKTLEIVLEKVFLSLLYTREHSVLPSHTKTMSAHKHCAPLSSYYFRKPLCKAQKTRPKPFHQVNEFIPVPGICPHGAPCEQTL